MRTRTLRISPPKIIAYAMAAAIMAFVALPVNAAVELGKPAPGNRGNRHKRQCI